MRELGRELDQLTEETMEKAKIQVSALAAQTHAMVVEKAQKLKSTRQKYIDAVDLKKVQSGDDTIWVVTLDKSAGWIEDGFQKRSMLPFFLASPKAKTAKDGGKYLTIPFEHSKTSNKQSLAQSKIAEYAKRELQSKGLDKVVEKNGQPVIGKVAALKTVNGPKSNKGKSLLDGLTVYQSYKRDSKGNVVKGKDGSPKIKRDIMTFRVASSKQLGTGAWEHPGMEGLNAFEEVSRKVDEIWAKMIGELIK